MSVFEYYEEFFSFGETHFVKLQFFWSFIKYKMWYSTVLNGFWDLEAISKSP